jgi:hypothetical protein
VCFDEYCKTYSAQGRNGESFTSKAQDSILQLLDGTVSSGKKIFMFTVNSLGLINQYMIDRQSRIRYLLKFKHMESTVVCDYVKENLKNFHEDHLNAFLHMSMEIMASVGKDNSAYFEVKVLRDNEVLHKGMGHGRFDGAYLSKDKFIIGLNYANEAVTAEDVNVNQMHQVGVTTKELTNEHFVGYFGNEPDCIELKDGEFTYVLRYVDLDKYRKIEGKVQEEVNEIRGVMHKKLRNNSISGASVPLGHRPYAAVGASNWTDQATGTNGIS